jgi:hypothetical protein
MIDNFIYFLLPAVATLVIFVQFFPAFPDRRGNEQHMAAPEVDLV